MSESLILKLKRNVKKYPNDQYYKDTLQLYELGFNTTAVSVLNHYMLGLNLKDRYLGDCILEILKERILNITMNDLLRIPGCGAGTFLNIKHTCEKNGIKIPSDWKCPYCNV